MTEESKDLMVVTPNLTGAVETMKAFQDLKTKLLDASDTVEIQGKKYIKRSGWRKIALAFNITTEIVSVEHEKIGDIYVVRVKARAVAPNGRVSEEIAACDSSEFRGSIAPSIHNIETKAATRAINRAISNLVGGGEVSAEELEPQTQDQQEPVEKINMETLIKKINWGQNLDGTRWTTIAGSPEAQALAAFIKAQQKDGKQAIISGKIYEISNDKYIKEKPAEAGYVEP